jgi:methylmalonyl-CoA/ethylmalonyl-CoA epimerase
MSIAETFGLGGIDQVSYAVRDLDEAARRLDPLFGPFVTAPVDLPDVLCDGRRGPVSLKLGFGRSGALEVELVQVVAGAFPQREFLERRGEGIHHVRFTVDDLDAKVDLMRAGGFSVVAGADTPQARFAYLEAPAIIGDSMVELVQFTRG